MLKRKEISFAMEFYEITLKGMQKLLNDCNEKVYADIIADCIAAWQARQDTDCMLKEFATGGRFRTFQFKKEDFSSLEQNFWVQQLFGGLVAMVIQLAGFIRENKTVDIAFIRRNFGRPTDVLTGMKCSSCGQRQVSQLDIDKYISLPIIAKRIADGLENNTLDKEIETIISVSAPEIQRERNNAQLRAANTKLIVSDSRTPMKFCPSCGNQKLEPCRFLKSVKEPIFVPLNK